MFETSSFRLDTLKKKLIPTRDRLSILLFFLLLQMSHAVNNGASFSIAREKKYRPMDRILCGSISATARRQQQQQKRESWRLQIQIVS